MSWLRNLQGQLSELANEVLNEATEDDVDAESELQVAKRRCSELESELAMERSKAVSLDSRVQTLTEQMLVLQSEQELLMSKYSTMVDNRDDEIRKLKADAERQNDWSECEDDEKEEMRQQIRELKSEVQHWKAVSSTPHKDDAISKELEQLRSKKEEEIANLVQQHNHSMSSLKEMYEERLTLLQSIASSSTSNTDLVDAVLLEKEELLDTKKKLEDLVKRRGSEERSEGIEELELFDRERDMTKYDHIVEDLRRQNEELTAAYNDLNEEYERFKAENSNVANHNENLIQRIDNLKANLIEYEERYELSKQENQETVRQLENLSADFERLRSSFATAREHNKDNDVHLQEEVEKLQNALKASREERESLRSDVERFRTTVASIDENLQVLREANRKLTEDNLTMSKTIDSYDDSLKQVLNRNENDLSNFRQDFVELQTTYVEEAKRSDTLIDNLKLENEALRNKLSLVDEESRLLREYNLHSKEKEAAANEKLNLLQQKIELLQEVNAGLEEKRNISLKQEKLDEEQHDNCDVDSLTRQLREALSANNETTNECDKLIKQIDELEKELVIRQGCVDQLMEQANALQLQHQQNATHSQQLKQELIDKERAYYDVQVQLVHEKETNLQLIEKIDALQNQVESNSSFAASSNEVDLLRERVATLESNNEQLQQIATQKHAESIEYYKNLQESIVRLAEIEPMVQSTQLAHNSLHEQLTTAMEQKDKFAREVNRLKEHLLLVEETSTREAVEAEARETELRRQLKMLHEKNDAVSSSATQATLHSTQQIVLLTDQVKELQSDVGKWKSMYDEETRGHINTNDALSVLQSVVRDLSSDHEREKATITHENTELQSTMKKLEHQVECLTNEVDRIALDKQAAEDICESLRATVAGKQQTIDDLEIQAELSRSLKKDSSESYRIDDSTLRQLFLSYFTSAPDKRSDIALLLASVLEYSQEDVNKIRHAVSGKDKSPSIGPSLAEQFVRFLETESESRKTSPHLPFAMSPSENTPLPLLEGHNMPTPSSSSKLDSILR